MSAQGELSISLVHSNERIYSEITSSRPMQAAKLFVGKTIDQTLQILPLLFNICAQAQAVTFVRAIESAMALPVDNAVEAQREALVTIESLREHSLQILMNWPNHIGEPLNNRKLSDAVQSLNKLIQLLEPRTALRYGATVVEHPSFQQCALWNYCRALLCNLIFGMPFEQWQQACQVSIMPWAEQEQTQAARFINWLNQQTWKYAGHSSIKLLPEINDVQLVSRLSTEQERFTAQPDWQSTCYEASWFNHQQDNQGIKQLQQQVGNGIYTRSVARLVEIADLMKKLEMFFQSDSVFKKPVSASAVNGLAHTDAARGRLSHYVVIDGGIIEQFFILAPTEWNFHPQGVAADGLNNLNLDDPTSLQLQTDLLIQAIDPCVGYQSHINSERLY
jgi:coenzyme F420-reducing hydrogenase alpha subunit